jgi:acetyl-CoA carboxylase biotin carboxyl carrier protein
MTKDNLSYDDLMQIVQFVESSSHFAEFHLKVGDIEIDLRKQSVAGASASAAARPGTVAQAGPTPAPGPAGKHSGAVAPEQFAPGSILVKSPTVGTFYRAPARGAQPFAEVGGRVAPDTTVCLIEVMQLMNSIPAGHAGVVTHILVENAEPVEFGQVLMVIDPAA